MEFYQKRKKYYSNLYPQEIYEKLEFDKILALVEENCQSPLGIEKVRNIQFLTKHEVIEKQLRQVYEYTLILNDETKEFPNNHYLDLEKELHLLTIANSVLSEQQTFRIFQVLKTISAILYFFRQKDGEYGLEYPELAKLTAELEVDKDLINAINRVLDEEGKIKSSASKALTSIRNNISYKYRELDNKFRVALSEFKRQGILDDTNESIRNGRRVLAVLSSYKRKVKGIIMDQSSSGRIVFMEPESTLQVNNELFELHQEEKQEIHRILKELTDQLRPFQGPLKDYQKLMGLLDFIQAKAKLAIRMNAVMPVVTRERVIELENAYHPLLLLLNNQQKKKTIPLSLRLSIAERILVISGPNAGGKSVSLKTIGLLQLMLQCGLLLPVEEGSLMGLFNNIFCDIGDEQSLENDLSTYSSRLLNMRYFTEHADGKTLILIDEFGSGTDPKFGGAIAEAILQELNKKRVYGVITTHYSNIKIFATETNGILNGFMQFDKKHLKPLYKLELGKPGSSYAFEIAEKCGLPENVLENARSKVGEEYLEFDELLANLQSEKVELDQRREALLSEEKDFKNRFAIYERKAKDLKKRKQKMLLEAEKEALQLVTQTNKKYDKLLKEWSDNKAEKKIVRKIKEEITQDRQKKQARIENLRDQVLYRPSSGELEVGASVQLREAGTQVGTVEEIKGKNATVSFGHLRTKVKTKELIVVEKVNNVPERKTKVQFDTLSIKANFSSSLDVRGMRREEALKEVESFVDKALIVSADQLKIIHGRGDGILRRSIREYLRKISHVSNISDEDPQYGGDGISIVELS